MNRLNSEEIYHVSGGDAALVLALAGTAVLIIAIETYFLTHTRLTFEAIDLDSLSSQEAYELGITHALYYCNYHGF
ncbi:MAG TPA: hypothetical protein PLD88_07350 [Candidatus Berkiella sp.]|nr:hypothetical protein [Candidatus Berkiella sp.]